MTTETAPNRRLIRWFIGTAIFTFTVLMHVSFANLGGSGLRLPFNATVWMGFGVMMALSMWPATRGVIRYSAFHKGLGLLLLALWLPFIWSWNEASLIALPRMLTVTAGAILLLGLAQLQLTRRDWWWLGMAILLGALMETALGYAQMYLPGLDQWLNYTGTLSRPYGIFQQVNVMASFLVTGLVISAWLLDEARQSRLERGVTLLAPLFMPALILVIQSRTGWLATLIAVPMVLAHLWYSDRKRFNAWGGALAIGCVLAAIIWWTPWAETSNTIKSSASSAGERFPVYLHSLRMIAEEPITGWGYGRFQHDFLFSFADWRAALPINQPEIIDPIITQNYTHPHNELLYWGIEGGLLPIVAITAFSGWLGWRLWQNGRTGGSLLFTALLLPLALHSLTELPFYHSQAHWLVFILLVGMAASIRWSTQKIKNHYTFGVRVGALFAMPLLLVFMGTHLQAIHVFATNATSEGAVYDTRGIINPLGTPSLINRTNILLNLNNSISSKNKREAKNFANELEEEFSQRPYYVILKKLTESYRFINDKEKLRRTELVGEYIYPGKMGN
ncbi:O-Antigen ligase [Halomonas sp. THAF5a]|uniref:O-antigen ligase family protein n=1 Tax=Halomonas sp. THAF5a TaxID=2587844 RepID=UPI001267F3EC|nr:Wzy polymerase domain-containing protein [Halomonas sp. THAF5a]QFU01480.1 O-Antigen ligase [Halomonas sp. THAF5a]